MATSPETPKVSEVLELLATPRETGLTLPGLQRISVTAAEIEAVEAKLLTLPQRETVLKEWFDPLGCYYRSLFMPGKNAQFEGTFIIGHAHRGRHINIIVSGKGKALMNGKVIDICGGMIFWSEPGLRKILYVTEDMTWITGHVTKETDSAKLRAEIIDESASFQKHELLAEAAQFRRICGL